MKGAGRERDSAQDISAGLWKIREHLCAEANERRVGTGVPVELARTLNIKGFSGVFSRHPKSCFCCGAEGEIDVSLAVEKGQEKRRKLYGRSFY